jgi:dihydroorotate dehydrogenase
VDDWYHLVGPLLRLLPPEAAHELTVRVLQLGPVPGRLAADEPILAVRLWGREFPNPLGLAAGFDKNARAFPTMLRLGFGFVEVGSVTPRPQPGNPKPRLFRLAEDHAVVNRLGFNSEGLDAVAARLHRWRAAGGVGIVGANVGVNRDTTDAAADYVRGVDTLAPLADYLVINVSSPNTPGLRALQDRAALIDIVARVRAAPGPATDRPRPPLLLKIAPDLTQPDKRGIAEAALESGIDGLIVGNTTVARPPGLLSRRAGEAGGLSGRPLFGPSTEVLRDMRRLTAGRLPLIGVGGVADGRDAYAKIRAGATLVQLYTALIYQGPGLVRRIKAELAAGLRGDGFTTISEAVGVDTAVQ